MESPSAAGGRAERPDVRALRAQLGVSQKEMAEALGCAESTLSKIENGERNPGRLIGERFRKLYGVDPAAWDLT